MADAGEISDETPDPTVALLRSRLERGPIELAVDGSSMGATISPSSTVTVVADSTPRPGQIWALADSEGSLVVHRYKKRASGAMVFRGDGNRSDDAPVFPDMLIGRVVAATTDDRTIRFGWADRLRALARHGLDALSRRLPGRRTST